MPGLIAIHTSDWLRTCGAPVPGSGGGGGGLGAAVLAPANPIGPPGTPPCITLCGYPACALWCMCIPVQSQINSHQYYPNTFSFHKCFSMFILFSHMYLYFIFNTLILVYEILALQVEFFIPFSSFLYHHLTG